MTDVTAGRLHKVIVHPLTVRITHWVNALAMVIMIMSGWRIYNSEPILPFHFPIALTLGAVLLNGVLWTWLATTYALRGNLLAALRNE